MKLYELPRNSYFTFPDDNTKQVFRLNNIDGMYSVCYDMQDNLYHIAAFEEIEQFFPTKTVSNGKPIPVQS
jgi:hypothetical protein